MESGLICIFVLSRTSDIYNLKIANRLKTSPFFRLAFYIMEIWKQVKDFPDYLIGNCGNVKSLKYGREKILKPSVDGWGYLKVCLFQNKIKTTKRIHKLVAIEFLGHIPCKMELVIDHIDLTKTNNRVENLRIVTNRENCANNKVSRNKTGFVGVSYIKKINKWIAVIYKNKKAKYLGTYKSALEASEAYQKEFKLIDKLGQ